MLLLYGEGKEKAFTRLREQIEKGKQQDTQQYSAARQRPTTDDDSNVTSSEGSLCAKCAALDIDSILSSKPKTYRGRLIQRLSFNGKHEAEISCSFCQLLVAVAPQSINLNELGLYAFPVQDRLWSPKDENVVLGVLRIGDTKGKQSRDKIEKSLSRTGYVASTTPTKFISNTETLRGRVINPQQIDYAIIRSWIHHCESKHDPICSERGSRQFNPLKLINCSTRQLEQATHSCAYLALSYVWGQGTQTESNFQLSLPKTVEDAITVTKSLGYKYLWVDKYCIDQNNTEEKNDQIGQMDLVYLNAELTIVAGMGHNSETGLPGVSTTVRTCQAKAYHGEHLFVSLMSNPKRVIMDAPWSSRGWTFQEALFSRRLLIFTNQQVYFECRSTNFCESVDLIRDWTGWNIFNSARERRGWSWHILERVAEYSKRKLTYQDDILNAFLGVLSFYENLKNPVYHHWGVPILPPIVKGRNGWPTPIQRRLSDGFLVGLCWEQMEPGHRRVGFPSWSWAGWDVEVSDSSECYENGLGTQGNSDIEVFFEDKNHSLIPWEVFWKSYGQQPSLSPSIYLSAYTISLKLQYDPDLDDPQPDYLPSGRKPTLGSPYWASFEIQKHVYLQARLYLLGKAIDLAANVFVGIILGESRSIGANPNTFVMVCQEKNNCLERIGHMIFGKGHVRLIDKISGRTLEWRLVKETFESCFRRQERQSLRIR